MSRKRLADELCELARHLLKREPKKPRQATLRRAVSTAYYAVFHLFGEECTRLALQGDLVRKKARRVVAHAHIGKLRETLRQRRLPQPWHFHEDEAPCRSTLENLRRMTEIAKELQEARHEADYDAQAWFSRKDAEQQVRRAEQAIRLWNDLREHADSCQRCRRALQLFAAAVIFGPRRHVS